MMKLFDAHCHLQDPRILSKTPQLIKAAQDIGVVNFAVNGVCEQDWASVNQLSITFPSVLPSFGLHPWYVAERSPNWFKKLKEYFDSTPSAAVGECGTTAIRGFNFKPLNLKVQWIKGHESISLRSTIKAVFFVRQIGLDKGSHGKKIDFSEQVEVLRQQLELAKELNKPASVHCVRAYGDLLELMKSMGPFPAGVILHSYLGSAEMVPEFSKLGAYFSFSGFLMSLKPNKAKKMLKMVSSDRILLETDAPDALPKSNINSLFFVEGDTSLAEEIHHQRTTSSSTSDSSPTNSNSSQVVTDASMLPKETLNHPANIHNVLEYVACMLEITKEEVAELSYQNAVRLFSYEGSKLLQK